MRITSIDPERGRGARAPARPRSRASPRRPPARAPPRPARPSGGAARGDQQHDGDQRPAARRRRSWTAIRRGRSGRRRRTSGRAPARRSDRRAGSTKPARSTRREHVLGRAVVRREDHQQDPVDQREHHERRPLPGARACASAIAAATRAPRPPCPAAYLRADTLSPEFTPPATGDPGRRRQRRETGDPGVRSRRGKVKDANGDGNGSAAVRHPPTYRSTSPPRTGSGFCARCS